MLKDRLNYWRRIFKVYGTTEKGYLSFWHETPAVSGGIEADKLGPYYQTFRDKAAYTGPKDDKGAILFDYYFDIGRQYNPLAVAQYGLGHWNLYLATGDREHLDTAKIQGDWLVDNLKQTEKGFWVWRHEFRWHYKQYLEPGWFSAHSQGTGISLLARLYHETKDERYLEAAKKAFGPLNTEIPDGGVQFRDPEGDIWLEEYLVDPPTHILNGYLWALWGVWDYYLLTQDAAAKNLFAACIRTLTKHLPDYDAGFWSLYDLSKQALKMVASPFYHNLHIVQLQATAIISGETIFREYAQKFEGYRANFLKRNFAFAYKALFKILYF